MADDEDPTQITVQFVSDTGDESLSQLHVPLKIETEQMETLINQLLQNDEPLPYSFFVNETEEVLNTLNDCIKKLDLGTENVLRVMYVPQSLFRVRSVTRCASSLSGHTDAVLHASFSPNGKRIASGSGDTTIRFWDMNTQTAISTCKGHSNWVLCVEWSPDGAFVASGAMDNMVKIWDAEKFTLKKTLKGHQKWVTSLAWCPLHRNFGGKRLASASKDNTVRIWDAITGTSIFGLSGHSMAVTCVKWGGEGLLYSGSQDRQICVWGEESGVLVRVLKGHAHWVNHMALSTSYTTRTGDYDPETDKPLESTEEKRREVAEERYKKVHGDSKERMVSGSDDFTIILWSPTDKKKPLARLTGHQQPINQVCFSPNGRIIASASFDKSIRLWDGTTGKYISTLRGHVGPVYQVSWSADSRKLVSGSKDSTLKLWCVRTKKLIYDLPGHADEVYVVDWSPTGEGVVSGSKDRILKIWVS